MPLAGVSKRALAAQALRRAGLSGLLLRVAPWHGVLVLCYHRIGDAASCETYRGVVTATAESFDRQLRFLCRHADVLAPDELRAELPSGRGRRVLVTFDDGYRDLYELAFPVLQANGVRAAMFVCPGFIDGQAGAWWDEIGWMLRRSNVETLAPGSWAREPLRLDHAHIEQSIEAVTRRYWELDPEAGAALLSELAAATGSGRRPAADSAGDWITWEMSREMHSRGHRIGAHTVNHPLLARLAPERQREEIMGSIERIEAELGERPRWLAYPVGVPGAFNDESRRAAAQAGIELAFSNYGGRVTASNFDALDVRRVSAETLREPTLFSATLALPQVFAHVPDGVSASRGEEAAQQRAALLPQ